MVGFLDTSDPNVLVDSIRLFSIEWSIEVKSLDQYQIQNAKKLAKILDELKQAIDRKYPQHAVCLIFDNAHPCTDIVNHLNTILHGPSALLWRILVTTNICHIETWMNACKTVTEGCICVLSEFGEEETLEFMSSVKINDSEKLLIHKGFRGHPLCLQIFKAILMTDRVSYHY